MPYLFGTDTRAGAPIDYQFVYGGTPVDWGSKYLSDMSDLSMRSKPLDGKFTVSELTTTFADTNGAIWGSLGHGTVGIGSSWEATVYIGGTMDNTPFGPGEYRLQRQNTVGAGTFVVHKGRITEISRTRRSVTIVSQNAMSKVEDLEWNFPVGTVPFTWDKQLGSNFFINQNILSQQTPAFFNFDNDNTKFSVYAFMGSSLSSPPDTYPTPGGRGTKGLVAGFFFPGTQFYFDYDRVLFDGSFLGTRVGTISDDNVAQSLGYSSAAEAEGSKSGTSYVINKTRLTFRDGTPHFDKGSTAFWQQSNFKLEDTPANLWQELLTGCCSTPLFGSADIEPVTFATTRRNTAFQTFSQNIDPKGGKVLPYLKNMLEPLSALWSVDAQNRFMLQTYGPRTYADVIGTIGMAEIFDSSVRMDESGKINRLTLDYGYVFETGSFSRRIELKGSGWGSTNDYHASIKCQWLSQDNDALITGKRILSRFSRGVPTLTLKVPFTRLGADVGSLYAVTDDDLGYTTRVFEVTGWTKRFVDERGLTLDMWDGDALYTNKGFARWEGDNSLTKTVSGTSLSGWGTSGTVNNINQAFFGSNFVWF